VTDVAALIVAAGMGTRFGGDLPKVFVDLAGSPLFLWSLRAFDACQSVSRLVLAVSPEHLHRASDICARAGLAKPLELVAGGTRRQDTVLEGLKALAPHAPEIVAIHDGARPLIDADTIVRSIELARERGACVTAAPVTDTIKQTDEAAVVLATPDRRSLWRAQTPQTFQFPLLLACYERAEAEGWNVTDDGSVVERCGKPVTINPGSDTNIKITTPNDLVYAEALMQSQNGATPTPHGPMVRVGHGYDVHALVSGRKLIIGGVEIPHETGLAGHSDADVLLHALCDAILGAAAAGDIGALFPDTDAAFEGMDSAVFCRTVAAHVRELGYEIGNVDTTVIAQRPKLAPHIDTMRQSIAHALDIDPARVSVKATTTERLGFEGREEGIAAQAVVLLVGPG